MRFLLAVTLAAAATAAPGPARADLDLNLDWPGEAAGPSLSLDVPELSLGGVALDGPLLLARGRGGGSRARIEPALCLVLGIIPGFGIGHLLAGSDQWVIWLVVDIVIAVFFWGPFWYWPDRPGFFPALSLLVVVERVIEGILAYQAAGGGPIFRMEGGLADARPPPAPALAAIPVTPRNAMY